MLNHVVVYLSPLNPVKDGIYLVKADPGDVNVRATNVTLCLKPAHDLGKSNWYRKMGMRPLHRHDTSAIAELALD